MTSDELWFLTSGGKIKAPFTPPPLNNHGKYVASLQKICKWLGEVAEANTAQVFPAFPGQELLWHENRVIGVRTGDKGLDHNGQPKANYEPGADIIAKVVVLGEGPRGTLTKQAASRLNLVRGPRAASLRRRRQRALAAPRRSLQSRRRDSHARISASDRDVRRRLHLRHAGQRARHRLRHRVGLQEPDDRSAQRAAAHESSIRSIRKMLDGGKLIRYGAKAIPEGGLFAMPRAYADGLLIVGDSAGFLNGMRLKGIHLGMKSGMLAAETIWEALAEPAVSIATHFRRSRTRFNESWAYDELRTARNFHQGFHGGMWAGCSMPGSRRLPAARDSVRARETSGRARLRADGEDGL